MECMYVAFFQSQCCDEQKAEFSPALVRNQVSTGCRHSKPPGGTKNTPVGHAGADAWDVAEAQSNNLCKLPLPIIKNHQGTVQLVQHKVKIRGENRQEIDNLCR